MLNNGLIPEDTEERNTNLQTTNTLTKQNRVM